MYPVSDWSCFAPDQYGYQRAGDVITGQASTGPCGSPVFACAGKTDPPSSSHPLADLGGYNWTDRYPWIVDAALKNRHRQFVIDGEAVWLDLMANLDLNQRTDLDRIPRCSLT